MANYRQGRDIVNGGDFAIGSIGVEEVRRRMDMADDTLP
jgi:hypothetical protein